MRLGEGLADGLAFQTLLGVTGSGKTYTMANVIAQIGCPTLVLAPNKTLAAQLYSEMREFFPNNAIEYFVSYYDYYQPEAYVPSRDLYIEKDSSINEHIEQMRLSATKSLLERRDVVIVATVSAIYGIGDPSDYHSMVLTLRHNDRLSQRDIIVRLTQMQYKRSDMEFTRGTFRVRGDTIDIFPAEHAELAVRVDLYDDEVDSIQLFDPLTGRVRQKIPRFTLYPSSHYVTPRQNVLRAIETIKQELKERIDTFMAQGKLVEAQRIEQRTRFDIEMLNELGFCRGIENYTRHISGCDAGRTAGHIGRLPAGRRADVHRRIARHDSATRWHVSRRPRAKGNFGRVRFPAAVRPRQSAAEVRRIRTQDAPLDFRISDTWRVRARAFVASG